jgi:hypothetical protein
MMTRPFTAQNITPPLESKTLAVRRPTGNETEWDLAIVYAVAAISIAYTLCVWGCVQHSLSAMFVGGGVSLYWTVRTFQHLGIAFQSWWDKGQK